MGGIGFRGGAGSRSGGGFVRAARPWGTRNVNWQVFHLPNDRARGAQGPGRRAAVGAIIRTVGKMLLGSRTHSGVFDLGGRIGGGTPGSGDRIPKVVPRNQSGARSLHRGREGTGHLPYGWFGAVPQQAQGWGALGPKSHLSMASDRRFYGFRRPGAGGTIDRSLMGTQLCGSQIGRGARRSGPRTAAVAPHWGSGLGGTRAGPRVAYPAIRGACSGSASGAGPASAGTSAHSPTRSRRCAGPRSRRRGRPSRRTTATTRCWRLSCLPSALLFGLAFA